MRWGGTATLVDRKSTRLNSTLLPYTTLFRSHEGRASRERCSEQSLEHRCDRGARPQSLRCAGEARQRWCLPDNSSRQSRCYPSDRCTCGHRYPSVLGSEQKLEKRQERSGQVAESSLPTRSARSRSILQLWL